MAFVFDVNDPSNLGMFSKAGRFTSEKHIIFQKKDEILNNQRKFLKVTSLPHLKMEFDLKEPNKFPLNDEDDRPKTTASSKNRPKIEPFTQQPSREDFYETKKVKHPAPPCGFYNPKFQHVEKREPVLFKYNKEKSKPQLLAITTEFNVEEASKPLADKIKKKIVCPTPLHLQTGRSDILSPGNNPHELRFTLLEWPSTCTRVKRPMTVDISKGMGREKNGMYKNLEYSPDYQPNFEFGKRQLGSSGPKFERRVSRKQVGFKSPSINQEPYDLSATENLKYTRPRTAVFDKNIARESDASSPLPSFMQKSVNSRFALGTIRQKTLEINNFSDGKFQTVYSSFSPTNFKSQL